MLLFSHVLSFCQSDNRCYRLFFSLQVTAAAGMKVNLVDMNADILKKSGASIQKSLERVAKKKFADKPEVT